MRGIACLIAFFCVASALGAKIPEALQTRAGECNCGWINKGRIVGGQEAKKNQFPLIAAFQYPDGFQFCGGTILTQWHVVTAAHCTFGQSPSNIRIKVGAHDLKSAQGDLYNIAKIINHEKYTDKNVLYDISLVVTKTQMNFNQNVGPACLPTAKLPLTGKNVKALGWGNNKTGGTSSNVLLEVDLQVISDAQCKKDWKTDAQTNVCTFSVRKDTCQGDSGGPLIWLNPATNRYSLAALVSYGGACAGPKPGVNTDVGAYAAWINKNIAASKPGVSACSRG